MVSLKKNQLVLRQDGFTLIELMVVVAIIGVLAATAIPKYDQFLAKTRIMRVTSEVASIQLSVKALIALYGFTPTSPGWIAGPVNGGYPVYSNVCSTTIAVDLTQNGRMLNELCQMMDGFFPTAPGMPLVYAGVGNTGEPRSYLFYSDGVHYEVMAYCFDGSEYSKFKTPSRTTDTVHFWGVSMGDTSPVWW